MVSVLPNAVIYVNDEGKAFIVVTVEMISVDGIMSVAIVAVSYTHLTLPTILLV